MDDERDRCRGALVGLAVGDALGMPAEELTPSDIRLRWGAIEGFEAAPDGHPCAHLSPGQWTDDTQLAILLAETMIAHPPFDAADFGARLAAWFRQQRDRQHWRYPGTACLEAAGRLAEGVGAADSGVNGAGCGAAMRVAPAGIAWRHRLDLLTEVAVAQARVTHVHQLAVDGAVAVARTVGRFCASGPGADGGQAVAIAEHSSFLARPEVSLSTAALAAQAQRPLAEVYSPRGPSGWTAHAVPAALAAFLAHPGDFRATVLEAVNAGGDTDSVGAIAGGLAGAALGWSAIPAEWRDAVEDGARLVELADSLVEVSAR